MKKIFTTPKNDKFRNYAASKGEFGKGSLGAYVLAGDMPKELPSETLRHSSIEYVPFLREDNNLFFEVFNALMTSPTNASILQKKTRWIVGDGLNVVPKQGIVMRNTTPPSDANIQAFEDYLQSVNPREQSITEVLYPVVFDFCTFGNAYVKLTRSGSGGIRKLYQKHIPFGWVRIAKMDRTKGETTPMRCGVSPYWDTQSGRQVPDDTKNYPLYPLWEADKDEDGVEHSIVHIKNHYPNFHYYGIPAYVAAVLHCELEYRIAKFNQSQFDNGFMPSAFMQVFGAATEDEAHEALLAIQEQYTGTGNNAKLILQVLSDPALAAKVDILQDIKDGSWTELGAIARENIITAHEWTQSLTGLSTAGSLGTNQQMRAEFEIVQNTVIAPMQKQILSQWLNRVLPDVAETESLDFGANELDILNNSPVSFAGDIPVSQVLTIDEQRELLGFSSLDQPKADADTN